MDYQLNLTEYLCPLPILTTKRMLMKLAAGDNLTLLINHSISTQDIRLLCEQRNCSVTVLENTNDFLKLRIQKIKG